MRRNLCLTFTFFSFLASGYAFAADKEPPSPISPVMKCLTDCLNSGPFTLKYCISICVD